VPTACGIETHLELK